MDIEINKNKKSFFSHRWLKEIYHWKHRAGLDFLKVFIPCSFQGMYCKARAFSKVRLAFPLMIWAFLPPSRSGTVKGRRQRPLWKGHVHNCQSAFSICHCAAEFVSLSEASVNPWTPAQWRIGEVFSREQRSARRLCVCIWYMCVLCVCVCV